VTHYKALCSNRRDALRSGLGAAAALLLARPLRVFGSSRSPPITKAIPSTGERLPVIGLGGGSFVEADHEVITNEIEHMYQLGGTIIDTAPAYDDSEAIIGEALASLNIRKRMFVATKLTESGRLFSGEGGVGGPESFERSLRRLRTRYVDLLQIHNLDGVDVLLPALQKWKQAGRVRYIGITTSRAEQHEQMREYLQKYPLDFVQVDYSITNRDAAKSILPLARQRKVAVLVNTPFGFGPVLRQAMSRALPSWAVDIDVTSWSQFLLKYVISHAAVICTIPGSTKIEHLEDNQGAAHGRLPDEAMRQRMEAYWDQGAPGGV
jgi:aryl-alcohol dehydrogenase-like predicted oxidoreductase